MWNDLSMKERAALIKLGVESGVYDIDEIRNTYNSYAEGGPIRSYKDWSSKLSSYWGRDINGEDEDYDYEKYYNDNPERAYEQLNSILKGGHGHFDDDGASGLYKKPNHATYPDLGEKSWSDNDTIFHLSDRQVSGDTDRILNYLGNDLDYNRGGTKVMYKDGYVLPTITVTPKGSSMELVPNKFHTGWVYSDSPSRAYKHGGYKPSYSIKRRISDWEGSSMKTNRGFEDEARSFNMVLPQDAISRLTQKQLDGLYSYSYNVGAGTFKKRVAPVLANYIAGRATAQDVQSAMWASKDKKLRGLAKRRNIERAMFGSYNPTYNAPKIDIPTLDVNPIFTENVVEPPQLELDDTPNLEIPTIDDPVPSSTEETDYNSFNPFNNILSILGTMESPRKINIHI